MKRIIIISISLLSVFTFAQEFFTIEGKKVKTAYLTKIINYNYAFKGDSVMLTLVDSQLIFQNKNFTQEYSVFKQIKPKLERSSVAYFNEKGLETQRINYKDGVLIQKYLSKYDSNNRLSAYSVVDKQDPSKNGDWTYHYETKRTPTGRIVSKLYYSSYAQKLKSFEYRMDVYYDTKGDTLKIMRVDNTGESTLVFSNTKYKRKSYKASAKKSYKTETVFSATDIANPEKLVRKQLGVMKYKLKDPSASYVENEFHSADNTISLLVKKTRNELTATLTIIEVK